MLQDFSSEGRRGEAAEVTAAQNPSPRFFSVTGEGARAEENPRSPLPASADAKAAHHPHTGSAQGGPATSQAPADVSAPTSRADLPAMGGPGRRWGGGAGAGLAARPGCAG